MTTKQYNQLVDDHSDGLYRFILSQLRNTHTAQDIVQEAYARLWENRKNVNSQKAKSYLFTTAYHALVDETRKNKRTESATAYTSVQHQSVEQYTDLQEVLHHAVNQLPDIQKSVILLRDYEGYSYQEISEITKLSESQVKVYIYRARVFLRKYIGSIETVA